MIYPAPPLTLTAGNVGEVAMFGWHPQVGGASVEDHSKGLRWRTDGDGAIVLSLQGKHLLRCIPVESIQTLLGKCAFSTRDASL